MSWSNPGTRMLGRRPWAWWMGSLLTLGCATERGPSTGGETHFLTSCEEGPEACGSEFECVCNVCTSRCNGPSSCERFPGAQCVDVEEAQSCNVAPVSAYCDVRCGSDADCAPLSSAHLCEDGVCRADARGTVVPNLTLDGSSFDPGADANQCTGNGLDPGGVLLIGDSFFAVERQVATELEELARAAGVLSPGERYRDHSRLVDNALALGDTGIAEQYAEAVVDAPVEVVIMNGGGADVLVGSCEDATEDCPLLVDAANAAEDLLGQMAADGVTGVVYVFYPNPLDSEVMERIDALRPLLQAICESSPVPCHWLDLRPVFAGRYDEYILEDGLNPTPAGARATAEQIWEILVNECVGQ